MAKCIQESCYKPFRGVGDDEMAPQNNIPHVSILSYNAK